MRGIVIMQSIKEWARERTAEMIETAKRYIDGGMKKEKALSLVLKSSAVGAGYKAQVTYEINSYNPNEELIHVQNS